MNASTDEKVSTEDVEPAPGHPHDSTIRIDSEKFITHTLDIDPQAEQRLLRKCDLRLIPMATWLYLLLHLDRTNIGNAKILGFEKDLQLRDGQFGVLVSILTLSAILLATIWDVVIRQLHPGMWLGSVTFGWGVTTMCTGFVRTYKQAIAVRFLCGFFESMAWPSLLYFVMHFYKRYELQRRYSFLMCGSVLSGAFGGLFAYGLDKLDGKALLAGWRWIFIVEGILTSVSGMLALIVVPNWPERGNFLNAQEKCLLAQRLGTDTHRVKMDRLDWTAVGLVLSDWKVYIGFLMHVSSGASGFAITYFIPTILHGIGYSATRAQVMSIPIYMVAFVLVLVVAQMSDRVQHRFGFLLAGAALQVVGYALLLAPDVSYGVKLLALFLTAMGFYVGMLMTIVWVNNNFAGHYKRSIAVGIATGLSNSAGFISPNIYISKDAPRFIKGYSVNLGLALLLGVLTIGFAMGLNFENRQRRAGKKDYRLKRPDADNLGDAHPSFRFTF